MTTRTTKLVIYLVNENDCLLLNLFVMFKSMYPFCVFVKLTLLSWIKLCISNEESASNGILGMWE